MTDFEVNAVCTTGVKCQDRSMEQHHMGPVGTEISSSLYSNEDLREKHEGTTGEHLPMESSLIANREDGLLAPGDTHHLTKLDRETGLAHIFRDNGCVKHLDEAACNALNDRAGWNGQMNDEDDFMWHDGACCNGDKVRGHERSIEERLS